MTVTVLGLGLMGAALARRLVADDRLVTVWNPALKLDAVPGATVAGHLGDAVAAGSVVLICLRDIAGAMAVLAGARGWQGRDVVNLSTGSPGDAGRMAAWVQAQGGHFVDGAVMNNPAQIGQPGSRIVLAGDMDVQARVAPVLAPLAADIRNVGANIRAAKATYLAFEMNYFGHLAATLHAADICLSEGIRLEHLHALHSNDPVHQGFLETLIEGHYRNDLMTLETWGADLAMIRQQAVEAGIASPFPDLLASWFDRAIAAGHGQEDLMAIWKTLA